MELWYTDQHTKDCRFSMKVLRQIASQKSDNEVIEILDTVEYGRVLVLDGELFLTEKDEFIYHEMLAHVPMAVHPNVRSVLVIGAGDGGTVRELIKYRSICRIDVVQPDKDLFTLAMAHLGFCSSAFRDKRVHIHVEEGLRFVRGQVNEYDLIIVDSADPYGPAEGLFTREFYGNCWKAMHADGILINQHESPFYSGHSQTVQRAHKHIATAFDISMLYQAHIPSYPSGHWLFGFASKKYHPLKDLHAKRWNQYKIRTRYYNPDLHKGCFALPNYVRELLGQMTIR
ncbi:MAG: polyamine aminopropyltransferase [Kiritimatiellia bacterium]